MEAHRTVVLDRAAVLDDGGPMLHPCSFDAGPGDVVALVGPNGSGKTTALRLLTGEVAATSGTALVMGRSPRSAYRSVRAVINEPAFWPWLTAEATLKTISRLYGDKPEAITRLLAEVGLDAESGIGRARRRKVGQFSQGMRKRLQVASVFVSPASVYLIDEPVTALDGDGVATIWTMIASRAGAGATIVVATHETDQLRAVIPSVRIVRVGSEATE